MDLNQIRIFNKICETRSFSNAAKELFITQPTVSIHLKNLEELLGVQLFNRKNKSQELLTEAGILLYSYTSGITPLIHEAERAINEYREGHKGVLSLSTSPTVLNWFIIDILKDFKENYPSVDIVLHSSFSPKTIDMVINRDVHFGIIRHSHETYSNSLIECECIASDISVLICSPNHKLAENNSVYLDDIKNEEFLVYAKNTSYWEQISEYFTINSFYPKIGMELYDIFAIKKMVSLGMGIAIVPQTAVRQDIDEGKYIEIQIKDFPTIKRYSLLIYRKDHIFSGPSKNFYDTILNNKFFIDL
ncbi:LysR family transcriptional regulator [Sporosarcina sp. FA9]|uniref:LysR family transcriptional regulator n=1 Tax=Sporosarcina sp. FA9 TaxID=3413030 RepID=UPI003F65A9F5